MPFTHKDKVKYAEALKRYTECSVRHWVKEGGNEQCQTFQINKPISLSLLPELWIFADVAF